MKPQEITLMDIKKLLMPKDSTEVINLAELSPVAFSMVKMQLAMEDWCESLNRFKYLE